MDFNRATTSPTIDGPDSLTSHVQGLLDKEAIRNLIALYAMAVDDHDIERVLGCFATDGSFSRAGNTVTGHEDLRAFFVTMMDRYVTTLHTPHSHVITIDDSAVATGLSTGHAELSLEGTLMMAAYRYDDDYAKADNRWTFRSRSLRFMYVVPIQDMPNAFRGSTKRVRWPEAAYAEADFPETLATWSSYN
jgi:uncharacterized protein (TIGR02246 family)